MRVRELGAALLLATLLTTTAACGGSDDAPAKKAAPDRPTAAQVSKAFLDATDGVADASQKYNKKEADCIAGVLLASKLSDAALRELVKDVNAFNPTGADADVVRSIAVQISACLTDALPGQG